jgi:hypothetical protein
VSARLAGAAALVLVALWNGAAAAWTLTTVDPTLNSGWCTSLRMFRVQLEDGALYLPRVSYWTAGQGFVYAEFDGAHWTRGPTQAGALETMSIPPAGVNLIRTGVTALALDSLGDPWIAEVILDQDDAGQGTVAIRHRASGTWTGELLGVANGIPSIDIDAGGTVHVLYSTTTGLVYAHRTGGVWTIEPFDPQIAFGTLRVDPSGGVHVAYTTYPSRLLYCATRTGGGWTSGLLDSSGYVSGAVLAFNNASNHAHILYSVSAPNGLTDQLIYLEDRPDIGWTAEPITPAGSSIWEYDLAVAPSNVPYAVFRDSNVRAAYRVNGTWTTETVDGLAGAGEHPSIAMDGDQPVVAYKASYNVGVRLASGTAITLGVDPPARPAGLRVSESWPNPAHTRSALNLAVDSPSADVVRIETFDAAGRCVGRSAPQAVPAGRTRLAWAMPARPGLVFVRVVSASGQAATTRVVVLD